MSLLRHEDRVRRHFKGKRLDEEGQGEEEEEPEMRVVISLLFVPSLFDLSQGQMRETIYCLQI